MNRLSTKIELARNGPQFKLSLLTESSSRVRTRARGAILGARSSSQQVISQLEDLPRQEEAVLSALSELSTGDSAYPLKRLREEVFYGDARKLEGVLEGMQRKGVITLEKGAEEEWRARLTLKGAVVALYGDWLLERSLDGTKPGLIQVQPSNVALKSQRHA